VASRVDSAEGWRNVGVAFVSMFVVFGVAYSFGAFFESMSDEFGVGSGATSAVFSLTAFCYYLLGLVSGRAMDRYGPKPVLVAAAAAMLVGLSLTAAVDRLWLGYVTYGLGVGIGVACGYVPMLALVGGWFERRRGTALGIAVAGIGLGTLAGAALAAAAISRYGWRTAYVVLAVASAVLLLACAALATRPPRPPGHGSSPPLGSIVRTQAFGLLYASTLLASVAIFVPFVFLPPFAVHAGVPPVASAALIGVIGLASVIGRLGSGAIADRFGLVRSYRVCFAVVAASFLIWVAAAEYRLLLVFAIVLGVGYGGCIALSPAVLAEVFGVDRLGRLVGLMYTSAGVGTLIGPLAAGVLIDVTGTYRWSIAGCFVLATAAAVALFPLRSAHG
jgi:MFS family permease